MNKLKILDLFSGIGGFSVGLERTGYYETIAFCEIDKYCKLLLQKHWKGVKIYDDVKKITKEGFQADGIEFPDVITGGFPCQPFSVAGKQKGTSDDRHLWPEMFRIIKAFKPRFVIGENVRGIINIQDGVVFETVCTDLESEGYEVQSFIIPAASVGAPHRRERVWIVAHSSELGCRSGSSNWKRRQIQNNEERQFTQNQSKQQRWEFRSREESNTRSITESRINPGNEFRWQDLSGSKHVADTDSRLCGGGRTESQSGEDSEGRIHSKEEEQTQQHLRSEALGRNSIRGETKDVADTSSERRSLQEREIQTGRNSSQHQSWWSIEPDVGRVAHGVQGRVHRLKGLGNAIVPQIAETIGRALINAADKK